MQFCSMISSIISSFVITHYLLYFYYFLFFIYHLYVHLFSFLFLFFLYTFTLLFNSLMGEVNILLRYGVNILNDFTKFLGKHNSQYGEKWLSICRRQHNTNILVYSSNSCCASWGVRESWH